MKTVDVEQNIHYMKDYRHKTSLQYCPYWVSLSRKCLASRKGLYIPLDKHVSMYCLTLNHTNCSTYRVELYLPPVANES